jgi:hypothetical protein
VKEKEKEKEKVKAKAEVKNEKLRVLRVLCAR